jgi:hypothetical protein
MWASSTSRTRAQRQIGVADDRLGHAARHVIAGRAHGRNAVDEFDLADRRHLGGPMLAIHGLAFEEHGGDDVMPAPNIGQQVRQNVATAMRRVPEVMMRINDRQIRLQHRFGWPLRQPRF